MIFFDVVAWYACAKCTLQQFGNQQQANKQQGLLPAAIIIEDASLVILLSIAAMTAPGMAILNCQNPGLKSVE
jgi:hypothetical protein